MAQQWVRSSCGDASEYQLNLFLRAVMKTMHISVPKEKGEYIINDFRFQMLDVDFLDSWVGAGSKIPWILS